MCVLVRLLLAAQLGMLPSADSAGYVAIADSFWRGEFAATELGVFRLPLYPLFLAALDAAVGLRPASVLAAQTILGLLATLAAARVGFLVGGWSAATLGAALFGLNPVFLFLEHWWMSEGLFVALGVSLVWVLVETGGAPRGLVSGVLLGCVLAALLLVRPNGAIVACVAVVVVTLTTRRRLGRARAGGLGVAKVVGPPLAALAVVASALLLWVSLVERTTGHLAYVRGLERARLAYTVLSGFLPDATGQPDLGIRFDAARPASIYRVLREISESSADPEAEASQLRRALTRGRSAELCLARLRTLAAFVGGKGTGDLKNIEPLARYALLDPSPEHFERYRASRFWQRYGEEVRGASPVRRAFGSIVLTYLARGRMLLFAALALVLFLLVTRRGPLRPEVARQLTVAVLVAFVGSALLHAWSLAGIDRFVVALDWLPSFALLGAIALARSARSSNSTIGETP